MAGFGDLVEDMDAQIMSSLADAVGTYLDPETGQVHTGIALIVDHDLETTGPGGMLIADVVGVTWRRAVLQCAGRGGIFTIDGTRYVIETFISDDGHMVTAACMEGE